MRATIKLLYIAFIIAVSVICSGCSGGSYSKDLDISIDVSPQGTIVFSGYGEGGSDLYILDPATNKVSRFTKTPNYEQRPSFDPKGKQVVYAANAHPMDECHLYIKSIGSKRWKQLTFGPFYDSDPRFSPDGTKIVFARAHRYRPYSLGGYTWDNWDIYTIDRSGSNLCRVTNKNYNQAYCPSFCSDNKRIIFSAYVGGSYDIYSVDSARIPPAAAKITRGSFSSCSADGKKLTFIDDRITPFDLEVWTSTPGGKSVKQITNLKSYITYPVFTHDKKHIFFLSDPSRDKKPSLWRIDANGKNAKVIAGSNLFYKP